MGRVLNLLDFSPRMTFDEPHSDFVKKSLESSRDQLAEKQIPFEPRKSPSKKKSNGTPMKMLIAHEMSKETESKQKPSNLVAKLMGLDALPEQQPKVTVQRSQVKGHLQNPSSRPGTPPKYLGYESGFVDNQMQCESESSPYQDQQEYKDVYEVWQQAPKSSYSERKSPENKRYVEQPNERGMDLVRQKFREAKRLATDENLRQSKEFQEALEVLSSNKELFLKFLQEPNSLFSQHLYELQSIPSLPHTKRITVLRPSKSMGNDRFTGYEEMQKPRKQNQVVETNAWDRNKGRSNSFSSQKIDSAHPTRIVVLKPSPGRIPEIRTVASSPSLSPRQLHSKGYFEELEDDEAQSSREVAKGLTQQMRETLTCYPREDTMLSSVFSNGYVGDESSFNKSDNDYAGEGNLSDSEIMTPTSRISWDFVNKFDSPYSSSFSRASYSPESSVCREAKKRLSERWAMMASNANGEEQRQIRRSSSTLGEMLALSETKKHAISSVESIEKPSVSTSKSFGGEQELRGSTSCLPSSDKKDEAEHDSPKNLLRSRSVPISSTTYGSRLNVEVSDPEISKPSISNEVEKSKSVKSSFKGKVSSLFFSRNKKQNKDKALASPSASSQDKFQPAVAEAPGGLEQPAVPSTSCGLEEGLLSGILSKSLPLTSACSEQKQGSFSHEAVLSISKPGKSRSQNENLDQPSPISVLEAPFEDEDTTPQSSGSLKTDLNGSLMNHHSLKSNLISKSPPIESLARSLSWDDASELATPVHSNYSVIPSESDEEQEWLQFIKKLLSSAGMDQEGRSNATFARWHSSESPLDPKLFEKLVNLKEDVFQWHEANHRPRKTNQKLIFDCVNEALVDITRYKSNANIGERVSRLTQNRIPLGDPVTAEDLWNQMREWFFGDTKCFSVENEDSNSLVVDAVVKREVVGRGWAENMILEVDSIGKEIEGKVLEELVEDALLELTGRC